MNKFLISLKKFFTNKNTVTVIGVIIILGLLYFGYTTTINSQTAPISVPIASVTIQPKQLITEDMIDIVEVPKVSISNNVIRNSTQIVGKFTNINAVVPAGSMFYTDVVVEESEIPGSEFAKLKEGERPYTLEVNFKDSYYNALKPGDVIDIYMSAFDEFGQYMVGRLFSQVEILEVLDSSGEDVFENTSETRNTNSLLIGVEEKYFILFKKIEYLESRGVDVFPVPYGVQPEADINTDREELVDYIESNTKTLSGQEIYAPDTEEPEVTE